MPDTACPSPEVLTGFVHGTLADRAAETVAAHLDACPACETRVEALEGRAEGLLARLRQTVPPWDSVTDPELPRALAALVQSCSQPLDETDPWPPAAQEPPPLAVIRDYRLRRRLGRGGMGEVFLAEHTLLKRVAAVKLLAPQLTGQPEALARFKREMAAIGGVGGPHVVLAFDAGEQDGTFYLAMEYIAGLDLSCLVKRFGPLPVADACELIRQAAVGLQSIHEQGLVHRDVKPSNLMLSAAGVVKILDLGLARFRDGSGAEGELTGTLAFMGTADYIAPEQVRHARRVDIRADLYSLGCTLYKLLAGRAPFETPQYPDCEAKLRAHLEDAVPPVTAERSDVPPAVVEVLERMLAKQPGERFAEPALVAAALAPWTSGCDLMAYLPVPDRRPPPPAPPVMVARAEPLPSPVRRGFAMSAWRWFARTGRKPRVAVALGALFVLLAVLGVLLRIHFRGREVEWTLEVSSDTESKAPADHPREPGWPAALPSGAAPAKPRQETAPRAGDGLPPDDTAAGRSAGPAADTSPRVGPAVPAPRGPASSAEVPPRPAKLPLPRGPTAGPTGLPAAIAIAPVAQFDGHTGPIRAVCFSPDAKTLASGSDDGTVRVWTLADPQHAPLVLRDYQAPVECLAFSPPGTTLACGGSGHYDLKVLVYQLASREKKEFSWRENHSPNRVVCLAFSPDATLLAAGGSGNVEVLEVREGRSRYSLQWQQVYPSYVHAVAFSPDGKTLAAACHGGLSGNRASDSVRLWNMADGQAGDLLLGTQGVFGLSHDDVRGAVAFAPEGSFLARVTKGGWVDDLLRSGRRLSRGSLRVWPCQQAGVGPVNAYDVPGGNVLTLHIARDGTLQTAAASGGAGETPFAALGADASRSVVAVWNSSQQTAAHFDTGSDAAVLALAFSPDGRRLATGGEDARVKVWNLSDLPPPDERAGR